ncbi:ATP-binding protein [Anaeromicrobium sediminis]|uniref:histidine kinase n=1 Tax=Anaeromicrobium sediminis TaxID=1478221 RepID=A0A267MJR3_9FIRM|nr:ATP-binding protein [Anaeromicrobium sediminis]PAB59115.1 hypothetical protein CCE28_11395 [Anaeromicrobium sediminis]
MKIRKTLEIALYTALAAQISINLFVKDFNIAFAIILFAVYMYVFPDLNRVFLGITTATAVYLGRIGVYGLSGDITRNTLYMFLPEFFFYLSFGILYSILNKKNTDYDKERLFVILTCCDFTANMIEIYMRMKTDLFEDFVRVTVTLFVVAIIRSAIVKLVLDTIDYYKLFILKKEHEERYRKLLWLTSRIKMEMYWIEKTSDNIESVMSKAYSLFCKISQDEEQDILEDLASSVAKDIHEIKKEYNLFIRGVEEIYGNKLKDRAMDFKEIMFILKESMETEIISRGQNIQVYYELGNDFNTCKHYYLMSIFRNIITNSIDAIKGDSGKIFFTHKEDDENHIFILRDNGCGIKEEDKEFIFHPGFSTKIDYSTGSVNRGLGLSLVHDLIKKELKGNIKIESRLNEGVILYISIPKKALEVNQ